MSVGDVKGFRRRLKAAERAGHTPKRSHRTIAESIEYNAKQAARLAKIKRK